MSSDETHPTGTDTGSGGSDSDGGSGLGPSSSANHPAATTRVPAAVRIPPIARTLASSGARPARRRRWRLVAAAIGVAGWVAGAVAVGSYLREPSTKHPRASASAAAKGPLAVRSAIGLGGSTPRSCRAAAASAGDVHVGGAQGAAPADGYVSKLGAGDSIEWTVVIDGSGEVVVNDVAVAGDAVYACGRCDAGLSLGGQQRDCSFDPFVVKIERGVVVWAEVLSTKEGSSCDAIAIQSNGDVVVAGRLRGGFDGALPTLGDDLFSLSLAPDGRRSGPSSTPALYGNERLADLAIASDGAAAFAGDAREGEGPTAPLTHVYDAAGVDRSWQFNARGGAFASSVRLGAAAPALAYLGSDLYALYGDGESVKVVRAAPRSLDPLVLGTARRWQPAGLFEAGDGTIAVVGTFESAATFGSTALSATGTDCAVVRLDPP